MIYLFPLYPYVISGIDYHITINQKQLHRWVLVWNLTPVVSGRAKRGPASLLAMLDGLVILRFSTLIHVYFSYVKALKA